MAEDNNVHILHTGVRLLVGPTCISSAIGFTDEGDRYPDTRLRRVT